MQVQTKKVKLKDVKPNPDNPRVVKDYKFKKLVKSLQDFPEMLELREIVVDENYMILGGNQRYRALQELGETEVIAKIVTGLSEEQKKEFIVKDNVNFGDFDLDALIEWNHDLLDDWGVELPIELDEDIKEKEIDENDFDLKNECPKCGYKW